MISKCDAIPAQVLKKWNFDTQASVEKFQAEILNFGAQKTIGNPKLYWAQAELFDAVTNHRDFTENWAFKNKRTASWTPFLWHFKFS